jgi:predicted amidophosphoribosyltransferase
MLRSIVGNHSTFSRVADFFGEVRRAALEFVYPPSCLLCHTELSHERSTDSHNAPFCEACLQRICPSEINVCRRCGARVGQYTMTAEGCLLCRRENFAFDEVIRLGLYRDELRSACLMAKNPGGALLGQMLADVLVNSRQTAFAAHSFDTVIPVPEHWFKRILRPQYSAETIARRIATRLKVRLSTGILAKPQWTPKQARSSPVQRRQQQKGAFHAVARAELRGQTVLLVDDILTTGATADAAARALKRVGAARVVVAVLAVSPPTA